MPGDPTLAAESGPRERGNAKHGRDFEALVRRCEARLRELPLPTPFDVEALSREIARQRGRPIELRPMRRVPHLAGFCFPDGDCDIIVYTSDTSRLHQEHIILHELCHLWCGHQPAGVTTEEVADVLKGDVDAAAVHWVLRRTSYSTAEEREAEVLASLILQHGAMLDQPVVRAAPAGEATALQRLAVILGSDGGGRL